MIKVNMMSGSRNFGKDWVHIDGGKFDHVWSDDIYLRRLPEGTVDLIFCSHGIAYFTVNNFKGLLINWFDAMAPGATLRLATPDFPVLVGLFHVGVEFEKIKGPLYGEMLLNGNLIHHKIGYTEEILTAILIDAGFINVERYDHRKTCHPNTGSREDFYDDHSASYINKTLISLNLQCKKP